jgi:hypothetical protein
MKAVSEAEMVFSVHLTLTEEEARALVGLQVYGDDAFIKTFYEKLGKTYL